MGLWVQIKPLCLFAFIVFMHAFIEKYHSIVSKRYVTWRVKVTLKGNLRNKKELQDNAIMTNVKKRKALWSKGWNRF